MRVVAGLSERDPLKRLVPAARRDLDPTWPSVSVVVPTLNESQNLDWLAHHMPSGVAEIILVDGGSTDDTVARALHFWPDVRVVSQTRRGKGNALTCGFYAATSEIVVMIDADGSMDPGEIPFFVETLLEGYDYAKGSRFAAGGGSADITVVRGAGNRALNTITNIVHRSTFTDLCYGYNAFWRRVLPVFGLDPGATGESHMYRWGDGFEIETLMNIRAHAGLLRVQEVPSYEAQRRFGASNLNAVSDGLRVLRTIAVERQRTHRSRHLREAVTELIDLTAAPSANAAISVMGARDAEPPSSIELGPFEVEPLEVDSLQASG